MLKLRLKRNGRKKQPAYRIVIINSSVKRSGRPIDEIGYYNPLNKQLYINTDKAQFWLKVGVKPTLTVLSLLKKVNIIN